MRHSALLDQGRKHRRIWPLRCVILIVSTLVGLGLAELAVRALGLISPWYPEADTAIVLHHVDPNGLIKLTPNWEGFIGYVWTQINANGFRDRVYGPEPPPGRVRVAVLGDSYTMGDGVPLDATYPKQLEKLLCDQHNCEVMNCGISDTNSGNQLETLREVLRDYHPHLVVVGYNINDFYYRKQTRFADLANAGFTYTVQPDGRVTITQEYTWFQRVKLVMRRHSDLYRWVTHVRDTLVWRARAPSEFDALARTQGWIAEGGHLKSFQALEEMQKLCAQQGVPFLVLILPGLIDMPQSLAGMKDYPYGKEHEMMHEQMRARGLAYLDLLPNFADEKITVLAANPFDRHYSRYGNEIVAKAALKRVEAEIVALQKRLSRRDDSNGTGKLLP